MYLVLYDIQDTPLRTRFAKFLTRYGVRLQYSVFQIINSPRILQNIKTEIQTTFAKHFTQADSVLIYAIPDDALAAKFGHPVNEDTDLIIL